MCLRLLDEKERQIGVVDLLQLDRDREASALTGLTRSSTGSLSRAPRTTRQG